MLLARSRLRTPPPKRQHRFLRAVYGWMGVGLILASIVGCFWRTVRCSSSSRSSASSCSRFTAYDAQRLKVMAMATPSGEGGSYAIVGALRVSRFINLFMFLLRFLGHRRD